MDNLCGLDGGSSVAPKAPSAGTEAFFSVRDFTVAAHQAVERLADMLSNDKVEGVRLQRPSDLMAKARSLMTAADLGRFEPRRFVDILELCLETGIKVNSRGYMGRQFSSVIPVTAIFEMVSAMAPQPASYYEAGNIADRLIEEAFGRLIGWPQGSFEMVSTSGASLANLTAVLGARNRQLSGSCGIAHEQIDPEVGRFDLARLTAAIKPERDLQFDYLGLQTLYDRHLLHVNGRGSNCRRRSSCGWLAACAARGRPRGQGDRILRPVVVVQFHGLDAHPVQCRNAAAAMVVLLPHHRAETEAGGISDRGRSDARVCAAAPSKSTSNRYRMNPPPRRHTRLKERAPSEFTLTSRTFGRAGWLRTQRADNSAPVPREGPPEAESSRQLWLDFGWRIQFNFWRGLEILVGIAAWREWLRWSAMFASEGSPVAYGSGANLQRADTRTTVCVVGNGEAATELVRRLLTLGVYVHATAETIDEYVAMQNAGGIPHRFEDIPAVASEIDLLISTNFSTYVGARIVSRLPETAVIVDLAKSITWERRL